MNFYLFRHLNGRSDESLNSSGDLTSSTIQNYPAQVYGDESDEGLVNSFRSFITISIKKTIISFQDSMSSADTARVPYDSDDADGKYSPLLMYDTHS